MDEMITEWQFVRSPLRTNGGWHKISADDKSQPPCEMTSAIRSGCVTPPHRRTTFNLPTDDANFGSPSSPERLSSPPRDWFSDCIFVISFFSAIFFAPSLLSSCQLFFNYYLSWPVPHSINLPWISVWLWPSYAARHLHIRIVSFICYSDCKWTERTEKKRIKRNKKKVKWEQNKHHRWNVWKCLMAHVHRRKTPSIWNNVLRHSFRV